MAEQEKPLEYERVREFATVLGEQRIWVISKPGLPNWDVITPATSMLAEAVEAPREARVLVLGSGHGALGVALARRIARAEIWLMDVNAIALAMAEHTLRRNGVTNGRVWHDISVLPANAATFDAVVIELPNGRKLVRRWLIEAHAALKPAGQLYIAGPNEQGIQSVIDDVRAVFGNVASLGYKRRNRIARAVNHEQSPAPAWADEPGIAPGTWHSFAVDIRGIRFQLRSLPGVFSYDRLDSGTRLLLDCLQLPEHARVLDVGCGYGVIGLFAARLGARQIDMVDVNTLAVAAARENIALNAVANAEALASDTLSAVLGRRYDLIVSNPPFHTGKAVDYDVARALIAQAQQVLEPNGQLILVTNAFIRYDQLLRSLFPQVEAIADDGRYRVLIARS